MLTKGQQIGGFILAGGKSSRMGQDKALLEFGGVLLIVRAARVIEAVAGTPTIIGAPDRFASLGLRVVADDWPDGGPLGGIATALGVSKTPWNLVVACDLPYLTEPWLEFLIERALRSKADAMVPMNERGAEPLCAMYHAKCGPVIRAALERGTRKVTDGLEGARVEWIERGEWKAFDSEGLLFKNVNSPADYEEARVRTEARAKE